MCRHLKTRWVLISKFFAEKTHWKQPSPPLLLPLFYTPSQCSFRFRFSAAETLQFCEPFVFSLLNWSQYFSIPKILFCIRNWRKNKKTGNNAVSINKSASWEWLPSRFPKCFVFLPSAVPNSQLGRAMCPAPLMPTSSFAPVLPSVLGMRTWVIYNGIKTCSWAALWQRWWSLLGRLASVGNKIISCYKLSGLIWLSTVIWSQLIY